MTMALMVAMMLSWLGLRPGSKANKDATLLVNSNALLFFMMSDGISGEVSV
jgi:hypothetical protein